MKRKTYMIFCIVCLVCLSTACTVQALTYENCHVILNGRSNVRETYGGTWDVWDPVYKGYLPFLRVAGYNNCMWMIVLSNDYSKILFHSYVSAIQLENATGTFVWSVCIGNLLSAKTYINADANKAVIE